MVSPQSPDSSSELTNSKMPSSLECEDFLLNSETNRLKLADLLQRVEIHSLKAAISSDSNTIACLTSHIQSLNVSASSDKETITSLTQRIRTLKSKARKEAAARPSEDYITSLTQRIGTLESDAQKNHPFVIAGRDVRLRFMEVHRLERMAERIGKQGYEHIKAGNSAAHDGLPVADASLCLTNQIEDHDVYKDLYGVSLEEMKDWFDVPEMVRATRTQASLQSEWRLTAESEKLFRQLLEISRTYATPGELKKAFGENEALLRCFHELMDCYDKILEVKRLDRELSRKRR
ncbi:hypothetical protein MMC20_006544 [Loxospora ochrophaea]|nr:hypothetical protein [Loxospora ochrophaea]